MNNNNENFNINKKKNLYDLSDDNINKIILKEKLKLCVVSYGGSCSNQLVNILQKNNYTCKTKIWHEILCHSPKYLNLEIPIIYIYDNPIRAFLSIRSRGKGYWDRNQQKLSNNLNVEFSDKNLLKLMIKQFNSFINNNNKSNILILKTEEIFKKEIVYKLKKFLNNDELKGFPIKYKKPKIKTTKIKKSMCKKDKKLFIKYKNDIDNIINYPIS